MKIIDICFGDISRFIMGLDEAIFVWPLPLQSILEANAIKTQIIYRKRWTKSDSFSPVYVKSISNKLHKLFPIKVLKY